jgi:hypothetical protein
MALTDIELAKLLSHSPYRILRTPAHVQADPIRFFRGAPATHSDIAGGWVLPRTVIIDHAQPTPFSLFLDRLRTAAPGTIWILRAPLGEGKSTFLSHIEYSLAPAVRALRWEAFGAYDHDTLADLVGTLKTPVVLLAELQPHNSRDTIFHVSQALGLNPPPCPLLIAAREEEAELLSIRDSHHMSFGPRDGQFAESLIACLKASLASPSVHEWNIETDLPNLRAFIANPDPNLFVGREPLFAALLRAVFGLNFRERLVGEYHALPPDAAELYHWVAFAHCVGIGLPVRLLEQRFTKANLPALIRRHSRGTPWLVEVDADDHEVLFSRHSTIAQSLAIDLALLNSDSLKRLFHDVFEASAPLDESLVKFLGHLIGGYANLNPIAVGVVPIVGGPFPPSRGKVRETLREIVRGARPFFGLLRDFARTADDWGISGQWAALMYHLLPERPTPPRPDDEFLLEEKGEWLEIARGRFPVGLRAQTAFYAGKNRLQRSRLSGRDTDLESELLEEWEALYRASASQLLPDFYLAFGDLAFSHVREDLVSDRAHWIRLAAGAYIHHFISIDADHDFVVLKFEALLAWAALYLPQAEVTNLLKECWERTARLQVKAHSNIGTWYAESLLEDPERRVEAGEVLTSVLAIRPWGEALLLLIEHERNDIAAEYLAAHPFGDEWVSQLNKALGYHAAGALAKRNRDGTQVALYREACENYELAFSKKRNYSPYRERWKAAIDTLDPSDTDLVRRMKTALRSYDRRVSLRN